MQSNDKQQIQGRGYLTRKGGNLPLFFMLDGQLMGICSATLSAFTYVLNVA